MSLGFAAIAESAIASGNDSLGLAIASPSGVSSASAIGSVTVIPQGVFSFTGVDATTSTGTVEAASQFIARVTGVDAAASVDGNSVASGGALVSVTGEEATSALGSVTVSLVLNVIPTSATGTGEVGNVTVPAAALPTGVLALTEAGNPVIAGNSILTLTGLGSTSALGSVVPFAGAGADVTSVTGASGIGSVFVTGSALVVATGVEGTGQTQTPNVWSKISPNPGATWSSVAA